MAPTTTKGTKVTMHAVKGSEAWPWPFGDGKGTPLYIGCYYVGGDRIPDIRDTIESHDPNEISAWAAERGVSSVEVLP